MRNLACFTTPFNWREFGLFNTWSDQRYFDVDTLVDSLGNVPPEIILASFDLLRPASKLASQMQLWDNIWNDEFVKSYRAVDRWGNETIPLAGQYFRQTIKELMNGNKLYTGELEIGGRRVDVGNIKASVPARGRRARSYRAQGGQPRAGRKGRVAGQGGSRASWRSRQPDRRRQRRSQAVAQARSVAVGALHMTDGQRPPAPLDRRSTGRQSSFALMGAADESAVMDVRPGRVSTHDLLFLARDITHPKVVKAWIRDIEAETITTLLAWQGERIVGCAAIVRDLPGLVGPRGRDPRDPAGEHARQGIGPSADRGGLRDGAGRRRRKDHRPHDAGSEGRARRVRRAWASPSRPCFATRSRTATAARHDILILSHDVARTSAKHEAIGLGEAF